MFAPTACTTPTRLPTLMWSLAVALLLLSAFAPAMASDNGGPGQGERASVGVPFDMGGWRVLPFDQWVRTAVLRRAHAAPSRLVPVAVLPAQRSALWFGLGASRDTGGARIELRWAIPLDGGAPNLRGFEH